MGHTTPKTLGNSKVESEYSDTSITMARKSRDELFIEIQLLQVYVWPLVNFEASDSS